MPANANTTTHRVGMLPLLLALLACCAAVAAIETPLEAFGTSDTDPVSFFYSRTDIKPPALHIDVYDPEGLSDGYIFVSPWRLSETGPDRGPYIYDTSGDLVWSGAADFGPATVHNPHVCQYQGADHLCLFFCFFQGTANPGFGRGMGAILDSSYRVVKTVQSSGSVPASDMHEFNLVDGGRGALLNIFIVRQYDLSPFGTFEGIGWIIESVFQEVRVETGELLFEWRSLDHEETSPKNSRLALNGNVVAGDGKTTASPWDYFHTNSIDKSWQGDYLVSGRHFATIYKISGKTGKVVWELRGQEDEPYKKDFNFSSQHDARWVSDNETHTVISLFDNAFDGMNATNDYSRGLLISINHLQKTAHLMAEYIYDDGVLMAHSQGSVEVMSNGNAFVGWGAVPFFSEYRNDGTPVMRGQVARNGSEVMVYRSRKAAWTATPADAPSLWTYSKDGTNGTVFYVSWNGATTVGSWNFYSGKTATGPWALVGAANKTGFETRFHSENFTQWSYAEAIGSSGTLLRRSAITTTFIPSEPLRAFCDDFACGPQDADPEAPLTLPPAIEVQHPDQFVFDGGFNGKRHYPPQPRRPTISLTAQVLPPILLGLAGFIIVFLFWVSPKIYARFFRKSKGYERVQNSGSPEIAESQERMQGSDSPEMTETDVFEDSGEESGDDSREDRPLNESSASR
ncbi:putative Arylsulfotransferase protein [Neofusicoccum parvum]|uniref:Arylsulfotransferase protein n=1 Tax=Neofusicoccum parvum TaxID=310453 RepID=A0ACB5SPQ7_9PEZI|nr:putative Arylsulfotransferase protein [Neofusicoccum parvum]GME63951.1 putative Arylsulfotransferase protein [Neofusicoccum parvum]